MREGQKLTLVLMSVIFLSGLCWTQKKKIPMNHYTRYAYLCYDACRVHENGYYWCNTKKGWDYCSLLENTDYKGSQCNDDHPCDLHGKNHYWCNTKAGSSSYCGKVEPKTTLYISSTYRSVCRDECSYDESKLYYWCNTDQGWDYCSPAPDVTIKNKACQVGHPCDTHGHSYSWCRTDSSWDYCGRVQTNLVHIINTRQKRQPNNAELICTEKISNNREIRFYGEKNKDIADNPNNKLKDEIEDLITQWSNDCLSNRAKSCLRKSANVRIDQQGQFKRNNKEYFNLQIQINKPRKPGESTTVALVILENNDHINSQHVQNAFKESFSSRVKVTVEVGEISPLNNQQKKCNKRS